LGWGEADRDRRIGLLHIHDHGVVRLHIHELVFDLPDRVQAKFLRFFGANHETTTDDMDVLRNDKIRMSKFEYLQGVSAKRHGVCNSCLFVLIRG